MPSSSLPSKLKQCRQEIDRIDGQIATLCGQRLQLTRQIFSLKKRMKVEPIDPGREIEIQSLFSKKLKEKSTNPRIRQFVQTLIQLNPQYPKKP